MNSQKILFFIFLTFFKSLNCLRANHKPIVIAHRGASGYLPEHTLEAKTAAYLMQSDYIEQDVVLTKDDRPIILHDLYLDEVTNVATSEFKDRKRSDNRYYAIDFTLEEIKKLHVYERFKRETPTIAYYPNRFPIGKASFQLSTLEEEIELLQSLELTFNRIYSIESNNYNTPKIGIYVEIKNPEFHANEGKSKFSEIVLDILAKYGYKNKSDKIFFQCFDPKELKRIRNELKSNLTLVQLLEADQESDGIKWTSKEGLIEIKKFADGIGPEKSQLIDYDQQKKEWTASDLYQNAKDLGLFIHAYTFRVDSLPKYANSYNELLKIFIDELKIDGIFSDFPDLTLNYIKNDQNLLKANQIFIILFIFFNYFFF